MLYATGKNTRRLFRATDDFDPKRRRGKVTPDKEDIPLKYRPLLDWYQEQFGKKRGKENDPILGLRGLGKEIWVNEKPDDYVSRIRGGWD